MATFQLEIKFPARRGCSVTRRRRNEISAKSPSQKPRPGQGLDKTIKTAEASSIKTMDIFEATHGTWKVYPSIKFQLFPSVSPPSLLRSAPPQPKLPILRNSTFLPSADPVPGSHKIYCVLCSSAPPLIMFVVFG